jgi:hypothetical protein
VLTPAEDRSTTSSTTTGTGNTLVLVLLASCTGSTSTSTAKDRAATASAAAVFGRVLNTLCPVRCSVNKHAGDLLLSVVICETGSVGTFQTLCIRQYRFDRHHFRCLHQPCLWKTFQL